MRLETDQEREIRHQASMAAYRALVDPAAPPRAPFAFEHHFLAGEEADITGLVSTLEEKGCKIETFAYDPDGKEHTWTVVALRVDLMEEHRILSVSDDMDQCARKHDAFYDGWLTRVE